MPFPIHVIILGQSGYKGNLCFFLTCNISTFIPEPHTEQEVAMCFLWVRVRVAKNCLCSTEISSKILLDFHKINTKQEEETLKMLCVKLWAARGGTRPVQQ